MHVPSFLPTGSSYCTPINLLRVGLGFGSGFGLADSHPNPSPHPNPNPNPLDEPSGRDGGYPPDELDLEIVGLGIRAIGIRARV